MVIYIKLLDEGTVAFRPAQAEKVAKNAAKLLPVANYDLLDENWEFPPGSTVRYENQILEGENVFVAVAKLT